MADGVYFEATSLIDGKPLVIVLRGRDAALAEKDDGANDKTGAMIQSYIMPRDESPTDAARSGADVSVCGDCPHRPILARESGAARCYVNLGHGPRVVYAAYLRGSYTRVNLLGACAYVAGLPTRFGSWGDPGAVDAQIWHALSMHASERTGYTHRWRDTGAALRGIVMASVDSETERDEAHAALWATFGVDDTGEWDRIKGEARCPASAEAGKQVTCRTCPLKCNGAGLSIVIMDHAPGGVGRKAGKKAA
jgi:hypothetical protein